MKQPVTLEYEGAALSAALLRKANETGLMAGDVAEKCGISRPYFSTIMSGQRSWQSLGRDKIEAIASFLEVPVLTVYLLSGLVKKEDLFYEENITTRLDVHLDSMRKDPNWMGFAPLDEEWKAMDLGARIRVILLYLESSRNSLIRDFSTLLEPTNQAPKIEKS